MKIFTISLFLFSSIFAKNVDDGIRHISYFIASEDFRNLFQTKTDLELIDTIFIEAVNYFDGDYSNALLALSFAALPFKSMPLSLPILKITINVPLPSVCDSVFQIKLKNLPKNVFYDSPKGDFGDKDKLAHFFGNAYLSYNFDIINVAGFAGIFVEIFEASFKVAGGLNYRDMMTNKLGETFGSVLSKDKNILPSQVLNLYLLTKINLIR